MNKQHTQQLLNDFPELWKHRDNPHVSLMGFGFECRDGWYDLIYNLCTNIKRYYDTHESDILDEKWDIIGKKKGVPEHFYVIQIKEKFGSLRFYITAAPHEIHDMIRKAEEDSYYICEVCGKKGEYYYRDDLPWIQTLCDDCLKKDLDEKGLSFKDYISDWQKEKKAPFVNG